jgi:ubiquinone/menaquinone biosynthesis C-methylase UbiE
MIQGLRATGVGASESIAAVLAYRAGTAWFAVFIGFVSLVVFRKRLLRMIRGEVEAHFDEIAHEYEEEIPAHVRQRLLEKKVRMMESTLENLGIKKGSRGLDLGCGQGWYLGEMNRAGYRVDGTDYSQGQLDKAKRHLGTVDGVSVDQLVLFQADAQKLPLESNQYDFVYSINAVHHMLAPGAQERALAEVVRVLRPGGVFILHEINTYNPVFRWYMGYLFPLIKKIDEGNEEWLLPTALPRVNQARWATETIEYFTFLPDFIPRFLLQLLAGLERALERSPMRRFSAHYQACLIKGDSI